eukprot:1379288-Amorphochlora_amoeboformis.AAC.1
MERNREKSEVPREKEYLFVSEMERSGFNRFEELREENEFGGFQINHLEEQPVEFWGESNCR